MTTQAVSRSPWTSATTVYHALVHDVQYHCYPRGKIQGCWRDNVFVERLWKTITYEEVYLHAYETVSAAQQGVERYLTFYNQPRPHRALDGQMPDQVYDDHLTTRLTAA